MDVLEKVVISEEDLRMVEDFFKHYNDPNTNNLVMTNSLINEIQKFRSSKNYTVEDQKAFTIALCHSIQNTTHPLLRDEAIKDVLDACTEVYTDAKFYEEFENKLATPEEEV